MAGAGVEERRRRRQIVEAAHQAVQGGDFVERADRVVLGEAARDAQHEVLRGLDDLPGDRVAQQIAAVQGAQSEVAEAVVGALGDGGGDERVEALGVQRHEVVRAVGDQALAVAHRDGLGERGDALRRGLVGDADRQEPGGQPRVRRVVGDEARGGLGGQGAQFGGGAGVRHRGPAAQRGGGDLARVGVREVGGQFGQGAQQRGSRSVVLLGVPCQL